MPAIVEALTGWLLSEQSRPMIVSVMACDGRLREVYSAFRYEQHVGNLFAAVSFPYQIEDVELALRQARRPLLFRFCIFRCYLLSPRVNEVEAVSHCLFRGRGLWMLILEPRFCL